MTETPLLLSRLATAATLGVSLDTIENLIARGELEPVRFGRAVRIRCSEVEDLIKRGGAPTQLAA
jgi:excisionase family DNA binding protein